MLGALLIVFREMIEAGLIVGIVLAATKGVAGRGLWVGSGVGAGVLGACILAIFAGGLASLFHGSGQELFNALILVLAVAMLTWHNVWMASHGREISRELKAVGAEVSKGSRSLMALAVVVGVAVLREGSEVVLFLYGIAAGGATTAGGLLVGGALGVLGGAAMSLLMYRGLLAIPAHRLFAATTGLITLLAAGLGAQAAAYLQQAGAVTVLTTPLWDTSHILPEGSMLGRLLKTIVGYTDRPDGLQLIVWLAVVAMMLTLMRLVNPKKPVAVNAAAMVVPAE
ncbi:MAG: FTR1 family protein [Pseudomonadota bacterium]|nr:FTR1 family protein [Pseudomonadota bacterium]